MQTELRYREHWIKYNPLSRCYWIERDGFYICSALSFDDGKRLVDTLMD